MTVTNDHLPLLRRARASWLYPIYVPTYTRPGKAPLLEMLGDAPGAVKRRVHLVVRPEERDAYHAAYPWATLVTVKTPGLGNARMRALQDADRRKYKRIVMLDDDIINVSLLERIVRENGQEHTRRYSAKVSGIPEPDLLCRSLTVACKLADVVFDAGADIAYGGPRNALFSGSVDTSIGVTSNSGSFPSCVMLFDLKAFSMRTMPPEYVMHGEDVAMFMHTMSQGKFHFTFPAIAYDQHRSIQSTIPLDPHSETARNPDMDNAEHVYPTIYPYLRAAVKNKKGGITRIGMNWRKWYADTGTESGKASMTHLVRKATS